MRFTRSLRRGMAAIAAVALAGSLAACAQSQRDDPGAGTSSGAAQTKDTFVFAASSDPVMLDPAMASDGETFRVARQMFEGLVSTKPGTVELMPGLAESWEAAPDGKSYTFKLRTGVKFHDGTDFNGEAVCANFDRWYNWTGLNQNENITYYYGKLFKGFKTGKTGGIYESCEAPDPQTATIKLNAPFAGFVQAMTLSSFAMQSPTAIEKYDGNNTTGTVDDTRFSEYATAHPTGTGPFVFDSWARGEQVRLKRFDGYWGDKAKVSQVVIRTISDGKARAQELEAGTIDGYDLVAPADLAPLKEKGMQLLNRPPFNILYLAFNQKNKAFQDVRVRQALTHAIDRQAVVNNSLPEGSQVAKEFIPDLVTGYNDAVTEYAYDPEKAKQLLKEAGQENLELKFAYPTGVSRPYMPTPEDTFQVIKTQLEKVGIKVTPVAAKWSPDYLDMVQGPNGTSKRDIHLLGWNGDYDDTDNFLGVFFAAKSNEWGFDNPELFQALKEARELPTVEEQKPAYEKINALIADYVPGVPIAHPAPTLGFGPGVEGYVPSPVQDEVWNTVTIKP